MCIRDRAGGERRDRDETRGGEERPRGTTVGGDGRDGVRRRGASSGRFECDGDDHPPARPRRARVHASSSRLRVAVVGLGAHGPRVGSPLPLARPARADRRGPPPRDRPREEDSSRGERRVARSTLGSYLGATLGSTLGSRAPNALDRASRPKNVRRFYRHGARAARRRRVGDAGEDARARVRRARVVALRGAAKPRVGASSARVQILAPRSSPSFAIVRFLASIAEGARRGRAVA